MEYSTMNKYALLFALALTGCSNKALYNTGQNHQRTECLKNATTANERDACYNQQNPSFEEYEKQRKEVITDSDNKKQIDKK